MRRRPSRLRPIWRRRTRPWAGFAFLSIGSLLKGLSELKRAKELSPANPTANDLLARVIVYLGRVDEAERQARQAVELDPLSVTAQGNLARVLFFAGKLDEADAAARKAAELQPAVCFQSSMAGADRCAARRRRDGLTRSATGARRRLSPFRARARAIRPRRSRSGRRGSGRPYRQWPG